jgi:hypothetical protein
MGRELCFIAFPVATLRRLACGKGFDWNVIAYERWQGPGPKECNRPPRVGDELLTKIRSFAKYTGLCRVFCPYFGLTPTYHDCPPNPIRQPNNESTILLKRMKCIVRAVA